MVSRLDRLFILLDTGSNESIRLAAARQIGEVQRVQPHELGYLLDRIKEYSCKHNWETRVAAGHAVRCVLDSVQEWPDQHVKLELDLYKQQIARELAEKNVDTERIIRKFDLDDIVNNCPTLLSTNDLVSDELDAPTNSKSSKTRGGKSSLSCRRPNKDQLQRQRQLINKELGMAMADSLGVGVKSSDIISNDDLQTEYSTGSCDSASKVRSAAQMLRDKTSQYATLLNNLRDADCISKTSGEDIPRNLEYSGAANLWPLTDIVKHFEDGLFDASWERRHGSAISLREIVKLQGKCAGKRADLSADINDKLNELWLIDIALKAVCVLSLDRFGDFLFDQVIAPVRENAAQLLGCCVSLLSEGCKRSVIDLLVRMLSSSSWETRHGGMLGVKYSLAVLDKDSLKSITCCIFDSIFNCLADANDDVSAEAAATLVLVKDILLEIIPDKTPKLIKFLWEHLADHDELTSSTSNIISLLASLITANSTQFDPSELNDSISRIWPLLNHPSTSVRVSVLKALIALIKLQVRPCALWIPEDLLATALRLIFQRSILENIEEVHEHIVEAWMQLIKVELGDELEQQEAQTNLLKCTSQYLNYWFCLTLQPVSVPIDRSYCLWLNMRSDGSVSDTKPDGEIYIGSSTFSAETIDLQKAQITKCRALGTQMLGGLYSKLTNDHGNSQHPKDTLKYLSDMFVHYLGIKSANSRMISAWTLESWASQYVISCDSSRLKSFLPEAVINQLHTAIKETTLCYDEMASAFTRLQQEARDFALALKDADISPQNIPQASDKRVFYNLSQIQSMCDLNLEAELTRAASKKLNADATTKHDIMSGKSYQSLIDKKHILSRSYQTTRASLKTISVSTLSSLACALIAWDCVPDRVRLLIDPLLDSVESEVEALIQEKSIHYLIRLADKMVHIDHDQMLLKHISDRLISTIYSCSTTLVRADTNYLAGIQANPISGTENQSSNEHRIILLDNLQRKAERLRSISRRQSSVSGPSTAILKRSHSQTSTGDNANSDTWGSNQQPDVAMKIAGARKTLGQLVSHVGENLPTRLRHLWQTIDYDLIKNIESYDSKADEAKRSSHESIIVKDLLVLEVVSEHLDKSLVSQLSRLPDHLLRLLSSPSPMIRHQASQCLGVISKLTFSATGSCISQKIIPMLESNNIISRCGSIETIALIIEHLNLDLVPKIDMFIVHVLRRMSDQNDQVRLMATHCFGKLLNLMPLSAQQANRSREQDDETERKCDTGDNSQFIEQLLDPKKLKNHKLQFATTVELRSYQQEGLNWLAFLNRFNLHGILCDEMGLGKTFMTICMVASDHYSAITSMANSSQSPSLIVCPPTLIEHWLYEIEKFVPVTATSALNPASYRGGAHERNFIRNQLLASAADSTTTVGKDIRLVNLVVTSYDVLRADIDFFKAINWNYCVLDEGHIIKSSKTKLSKAIRLITAKHRLILSGTPIQNNVTELWSLFDFLMPGFLGSERQFSARYARPILQSRELKCSSKELEAGALAIESLHRQVLPFILRRQKEDVLDDLPPKILQDYYCELSPLQSKLYEDFTRGKLCKDVTKKSLDQLVKKEADSTTSSSRGHVFQALHYLRCVCNHPKLVLSPKHSQFNAIKKYLEAEKLSLDDICHSSKLTALRQLLFDCGIGNTEDSQQSQQKGEATSELDLSIVNQHRALIFCQLRSMVELIENDLFKKHLPNITYLKLDGSVPPSQRQSIVSRFNNDPSIDVLLLTTHIGGLGLNLTGADTVIFVEHDWNPTRDLQAMDRAHRIGQKKVVNVYRLITKETLEEKIMGLQRFKTMVSNTVINQDNTGLGTMNVDQLLDLFDSGDAAGCSGPNASSEEQKKHQSDGKKSSVADLLPDLWDQQQYETEYDLDNFVASLKS